MHDYVKEAADQQPEHQRRAYEEGRGQFLDQWRHPLDDGAELEDR